MRILVCSDSHSGLSFMRRSIRALAPDVLIHLGDYYDDAQAIHEEFPTLPLYQVPGNCDRYRAPMSAGEILIQRLDGVELYLTHGHLHGVKSNTDKLIAAVNACGCHAVLYGHTHRADCRREKNGLWVLNPGSCGYHGGSVGWMELSEGEILQCRILHQEDLPL